jgi:acetylornithine/succinyldiaminopimelate/putrescine aminotransferase
LLESRSGRRATAPSLRRDALLPVYSQFPIRPVSGRGSWLIDEDGNEWLDAYGGHAVAATGHSHPDVVRAIAEQAERLLFYSSAVPHANRERLAQRLVDLCPEPLSRVFFCNSGAEANENALHLARKHTGRQLICSLEGGWHGRTAAVLAVTDGEKYMAGARRAGVPLSRKIAFNSVPALNAAMDDTVAGLIIEPVQGMAGARDCSPEFLRAARQACDRAGAVLIFDEVQCGVGRCGGFTAAEAYGTVPDIVAMAKGLASGLPIGAVIASDRVTAGVGIGDLGSTFGGGPVPCAAALATLDVIERDRLVENAIDVGGYLAEGALSAGAVAVQGKGLLLGLRLPTQAVLIQEKLFARRILTGTSSDPAVLRLLPPLSFSRAEADLFLAGFKEALA